ncbi:ubiquitin-conjugating enzyme E2 4 [Drosophila eugracilis]|uniref:ubiquitin-conjugating enzyme E2 4 n=1 Tax=Drosophila eugracilis TaxID=29029 RepID=UPI0007E76DDE|nr:ubiquitin-conjugating enzyme E2 4 [Drosophila eugracilis]
MPARRSEGTRDHEEDTARTSRPEIRLHRILHQGAPSGTRVHRARQGSRRLRMLGSNPFLGPTGRSRAEAVFTPSQFRLSRSVGAEYIAPGLFGENANIILHVNPDRFNNTQLIRRRNGISVPSAVCASRLQREIAEFASQEIEGCTIALVDDNLLHWIATIPGPPETPYEGGWFKLEMIFPKNYPFHPPYVVFLTRIFHCNIALSGRICVDILGPEWSPALSASKVLLSIMSLLSDPNPYDPLEADFAHLYRNYRQLHDDNARNWTNKYATQRE